MSDAELNRIRELEAVNERLSEMLKPSRDEERRAWVAFAAAVMWPQVPTKAYANDEIFKQGAIECGRFSDAMLDEYRKRWGGEQ